MSETGDQNKVGELLDPEAYRVGSDEFAILDGAANQEVTTCHGLDATLAFCHLRLQTILGDDLAAKSFIKELSQQVRVEVLDLDDPEAIEKMLAEEVAINPKIVIPEQYLPIFVEEFAKLYAKPNSKMTRVEMAIVTLFNKYLYEFRYRKIALRKRKQPICYPEDSPELSIFYRELKLAQSKDMEGGIYEKVVHYASYLVILSYLIESPSDWAVGVFAMIPWSLLTASAAFDHGAEKGGIVRKIADKINAAIAKEDPNRPIVKDYLLRLGEIRRLGDLARKTADNYKEISEAAGNDNSLRTRRLLDYLGPLFIANRVMARVQRALDEGENAEILAIPLKKGMRDRENRFRLNIEQDPERFQKEREGREGAKRLKRLEAARQREAQKRAVLVRAEANMAKLLEEAEDE